MANSIFMQEANPASESWQAIRQSRADPGVELSKMLVGQRKKLFHAALQQSQQQFEAAALIGRESRPLNLFYGLSQAGRAIAAASQSLSNTRDERGRDPWRASGHGIKFNTDGPLAAFFNRTVASDTKGMDSFSRLSLALDSPLDFGAVSFGQLIAQLPEVWLQFRHLQEHYSVPIFLSDWYLPMLESTEPPYEVEIATPGLTTDATTVQAQTYLGRYPDLAALKLKVDDEGTLQRRNPGHLLLDVPDRSLLVLTRSAGYYLPAGTRIYRRSAMSFPASGDSSRPLHPLAVWWMALFALSMMSRYAPLEWSELLDIESSRIAATLEYFVDVAVDAVPALISDALLTLNTTVHHGNA